MRRDESASAVRKTLSLKMLKTCLTLSLVLSFLSTGAASAEMYVYGSTLPGQLWYFDSPYSVAVDVSGNVYVADTYKHLVLKYNSSGVLQHTWGVTGVSGSDNDHFNNPFGVAVDGSSVYVADTNNHRIQKFDATTFARTATLGTAGVSGTDNSHFNQPNGVAVDGFGTVYVADTFNNRIQIISAGGTSTLNSGNTGGDFNRPLGVAVDTAGKIYVADTYRHRIQVFDAGLVYLTTIGQTDSTGSDTSHFDTPQGVAVDSSGTIYVADTNNHRVQKCSLSGDPTPVPSCLLFLGETFVPGIDNSHLTFPSGVAVEGANVYVADTQNWRIQKFTGAGAYAATWGSIGLDNAHLNFPNGVAVDGAGNIHIADSGNQRIQKFSPAGAYSSTLGESGVSGGDSSHFWLPMGVAAGSGNKICVADTNNSRILKFDGSGGYLGEVTEGPLSLPYGAAFDAASYLYVADTFNHAVRKFDPSGFIDSTFVLGAAGTSGYDNDHFDTPSGIAVDGSGNIYVADTNNHRIQKFSAAPVWQLRLGEAAVAGTDNSHFDSPGGVAVDGSGNIYVADTNNHRVQKFSPGGAWLLTLGEAAVPGYDNDHFDLPSGIAVDGSGNIHVADTYNHRIQKFLRLLVTPVTSGPGSISCRPNLGDPANVTCTVTPLAGSYVQTIFAGATSCWPTYCYSSVTSPYTFPVPITEDMTIQAVFLSYPVKRVSGSTPSYHMTLAEAYGAALNGDGIKIQSSPTMSGPFTVDKSLSVAGGYAAGDPTFTSQTGHTTIDGGTGVAVTVGLNGQLTVDRLVLR